MERILTNKMASNLGSFTSLGLDDSKAEKVALAYVKLTQVMYKGLAWLENNSFIVLTELLSK